MTDADMTRRARALADAFDQSFSAPARSTEEEGVPALAIRVAGEPYALLLGTLVRITRRPRIVPLPGAPRSQIGLAGVDGELVTVHSLPSLLGYEAALHELAWVAVARGAPSVALAFEVLEGQIVVPAAGVSASPAGARRHVSGLIGGVAHSPPRALVDLPSMLERILDRG